MLDTIREMLDREPASRSTVSIRRLRIGEAQLFKEVRLAALREAPSAFESTYESALARSANSWREQADASAHGSDRATFIALAGSSAVGMMAIYRQARAM